MKVIKRGWFRALVLVMAAVLIAISLTYAYYLNVMHPLELRIPPIDNFTINSAVYQPLPAAWTVRMAGSISQARVTVIVVCGKGVIIKKIVSNNEPADLGIVPAGTCVVFLRIRVSASAYVTSSNLYIVVDRKPVWRW